RSLVLGRRRGVRSLRARGRVQLRGRDPAGWEDRRGRRGRPNSEQVEPGDRAPAPDGSLDPTFGDHGRRIVKVPDGVSGFDGTWRVVIQAHGTLAMAGWDQRPNSSYKTLVLRLTSNGLLDTSFGGDGVVVLDADGVDNYSYGLA